MPQLPELASFPVGTVLNSYGEKQKNFLVKIVYGQIRRYQKKKYPNSERTRAVHSMLHLGGGDYLSVESPRAVIKRPELDAGCSYSWWTYKNAGAYTAQSWTELQGVARNLVGKPYDYGQLLDILVKQVFGWIPDGLRIFDFSRRRKVCSVAVHVCLLKAWKTIPEAQRPAAAPLGRQQVEVTCPADFENHDSFVMAGEYKP
jgi:hypothetical protein